LENKFVS